jgi:hypothetical protein
MTIRGGGNSAFPLEKKFLTPYSVRLKRSEEINEFQNYRY